MNKKYRPEIKICGITSLDDARAACDAGADYLGFVLYQKSPRAIAPAALRRLIGKLNRNIKCVGVFVNEPPMAVARIASDCGLCIVQLCGDESYAEFRSFPMPVWRVTRIHNGRPEPDFDEWPAVRYVLDSSHGKNGKKYGGTGKTVDWNIAARLAGKNKIMLAGGLNPENAVEAVRIVRPAGVDAASGVESKPGKKDHAKLRFFIELVKNA